VCVSFMINNNNSKLWDDNRQTKQQQKYETRENREWDNSSEQNEFHPTTVL
jgi:hypothetical protein